MSEATTASASNWRTTIGTGVGSFRGVAFDVQGQQSQNGGRRTVKREFPGRENGGADDLGARLRERTFNAVIVGGDYLSRRDAFIAALDAPGPGELVHPNFGTKTVQIDTWRCDEDTSDGGKATFSITHLPPLDTTAPISTADAASKTSAAATAAATAADGDFTTGWNIGGMTLHDLTALADDVTAKVNAITASVQGYLGIFDDLSSFMTTATTLQASVSALIYQPAMLAHQMRQLIDGVKGIAASTGQAFNVYGNIADRLTRGNDSATVNTAKQSNGTEMPVLITAPTSEQGKAAVNQFDALTYQAVVINQAACASAVLTDAIDAQQQTNSMEGKKAAELVVSSPVDDPELRIQSRDDAQTITDSIATHIDAITLSNSQLGWLNAEDYTRRLRLIFIADMTARARLLPGTQQAVPTITQPVLMLLNNVTGDSSSWAEFTRRNNIKNPLFLMAGNTYEVLDD